MRGRGLLGYQDAVAILTGDSAGLAAADRALGGALSMATGGVSDAVLSVFDAQGRILRLGRDLTSGLRGNLGAADRASRTELLAAAHTVLVVTAYFEALGELELPFRLEQLELTRREQLTLSGAGDEQGFLATLLSAGVPQPAPHLPYEDAVRAIHRWYCSCSGRLVGFVEGLAVWDRLDERCRATAVDAITHPLNDLAVSRYEELYAQLALEVPEFGFWTGRVDHQATRVTVRQALAGIETVLAGLSAPGPLQHAAAALATGYRAALPRPILSEVKASADMTIPELGEGYVDPDFRVRAVLDGAHGPAEEGWWESEPVRSDLTEYLAGVLTSVAATTAPLVVLGQPGAGKSVLTKILAARLPTAGYLPVRVVLRDIPADADVQDQIEYAVRAATGERVSWPELVRAAGSAVPVLLFDGFDELLQATGVSQSDFLIRVARFQEREADQGRPVFALVTSRTAVADRARYPDGAVALRLEPFSRRQIERWLAVWNRLNEPGLTERGLRPLTAAVAARHRVLASQPLLLMMLALYDGAANALQGGEGDDEPLGEAELYEQLLVSFAVREVGKSAEAWTATELVQRAEQELQRLSLISFGMLNRRRQWITTTEAEQDLAALLGRAEPPGDGFRAPLNRGEIALGRFFFVQRAQASRDDQRLTTYEFLHATFGEYLAARLAVQLLEGLLDQRPALAVGRVRVDDDLLYVLLSYAPLSSRQMLRFVGARIRGIAAEDRTRLGELLVTVMAEHRGRTEHRFADYRPAFRATSSRHGLYEANLIMLTLLVTGGMRAGELYPDDDNPPGTWHRRVLLWRSAFTEPEWTDFALALSLRHTWHEGRGELDIRPAEDLLDSPEPVDAFWLYGRPPGSTDRNRRISWARPYPDQIRHKLAVSAGTNDGVVLHAVDPLFRRLGPAVTTFVATPRGAATSVAHGLTALWLASGLGATGSELAALYEHCATFLEPWSALDEESLGRTARLVLGQLVTDAALLPPAVVCAVLNAPAIERLDTEGLALAVTAGLTALHAHPCDATLQQYTAIYADALGRAYPARLFGLWSQNPWHEERLRPEVVRLLATLSEDDLSPVPAELLDRARRSVNGSSARPPGSA
ncbi:NACHT domain-containing protein [Streptomyces sp. NPDC056437]|uniref:NACHT domain-containing protein n=1 Tax=Streptomyces sp. NPDC056437 TaxID=3345816 RepID=UPI0036BBCF4F